MNVETPKNLKSAAQAGSQSCCFNETANNIANMVDQEGANVLFFTFINPATMDVPAAFQKLGNF